MPIWSFYCTACDTITDRMFARHAESVNVTCLTCGSTVERLPSTGSFIVTGYNAKNLYSKKS